MVNKVLPVICAAKCVTERERLLGNPMLFSKVRGLLSLGKKWNIQTNKEHVGFEVLTAVVIKSSVFWDMTQCSPLKVDRRFRGTCPLHRQCWRVSQREISVKQATIFASLTLQPWRWRWQFTPKRRLTFNGLHGVISQKVELFKQRTRHILKTITLYWVVKFLR
jgi:hypothetical protein